MQALWTSTIFHWEIIHIGHLTFFRITEQKRHFFYLFIQFFCEYFFTFQNYTPRAVHIKYLLMGDCESIQHSEYFSMILTNIKSN